MAYDKTERYSFINTFCNKQVTVKGHGMSYRQAEHLTKIKILPHTKQLPFSCEWKTNKQLF
jgi:hypothetical protein